MIKNDYLKLNVNEKVKYINEELLKNKQLKEIAEILGVSSSYVSKELNDNGYYFNRATKQYVLKEDKKMEKTLTENKTMDVMRIADFCKGGLANKGLRTYAEVTDQFDQIAEKYPFLKKQDLLALAILDFVEKYK